MFGSGRKPARLENWDGRRRSSREEPAILPRTWSRPTTVRLALVFLATLGITALLHVSGPAFPHRIGESSLNDLRARVAFELPNELDTPERIEGEGVRNPSAPPSACFPEGTLLIKQGQRVTPAKWELLLAEHRAYQESLSFWDHAARLLALLLISTLLTLLLALYVTRFQPALAQHFMRLLSVCGLVLVTVALALLLSRMPGSASPVPLILLALVMAIAYNPPFALLVSFSVAIVMSVAAGIGLTPLLIQAGGMATAILLLHGVRARTRPVEVAAAAGCAVAAMTLAAGILSEQSALLVGLDALRNFLWCLLAGCILTGSLPFIERCFGVVTDASLLELADGSHPLLQELVRRAPGTYTHCMTVATLAEAAAEAVGANALLVRVGSYYHDIGKMTKPHYFIENQAGENRHDALEPALSTLVIMNHIKDGMALARQYRLPRPLVDFIQQHHGTTLVEYFYREAMRLQEAHGHGCTELEFAFRYPGPKPQSKEAGVLMLADAVESASRALLNPTPNSLRKLVHEMLMKRLLDGQFDESGLTLTELYAIEESLAKSLTAVYHARIRYPIEAAKVG
jgi:cyclic-di-AMP phosphodiesterase PgpH